MLAWTVNSRQPLSSRTSADHGMKGPLTTMDSALRTEIDMPATASAIELNRTLIDIIVKRCGGYRPVMGDVTDHASAITLRAGVRLKSSVDTTEVLVVRAPAAPSIVRCGGEPMFAVADSSPSEPTDSAAGVRPGQRLRSEGSVEFEVLVLRGGSHSLSIDDHQLRVRDERYGSNASEPSQ